MQQINEFGWQTHYTFFSFISSNCKPYYIPKSGLFTWEDLVNAIGEEMRYEYDFIQIMINQKKVDYQRQTCLVDIPITEDDDCFVVKRKKFENEGERVQYQKKRKQLKQKCKKELQREQQYPQIKQMIDFAKKKYQTYFDILRKKYGTINAAVALTKCEYEKDEVLRGYIERGAAAKQAMKIIVKNERKQLQTFLTQNNQIKEIYDNIFKQLNKFDQFLYRGVMQELYNIFPDFRRLQFRHRRFVKKFFFGQKYKGEIDSDEQQENMGDQSAIKEKRRYQFILSMRKSYDEKSIKQALYQAGNDYKEATKLLQNGLIEGVQNMPFLVTKKGRINYLLQFLANPKFDKIREKLRNNNDKAISFLDWICETNTDNVALCQLIKHYKRYALSFLTGNYQVTEKNDSLKKDNSKVKYEKLNQAEINTLKEKIKKVYNKQRVNKLVSKNIERELAQSIVRAAANDQKKIEEFCRQKAIYRNFVVVNGEDAEQYISSTLRRQRDLIKKLRNEEFKNIWLASVSQTSPFFFDMILRNYNYFQNIVKNSQ